MAPAMCWCSLKTEPNEEARLERVCAVFVLISLDMLSPSLGRQPIPISNTRTPLHPSDGADNGEHTAALGCIDSENAEW